jgi:hypothetical protein
MNLGVFATINFRLSSASMLTRIPQNILSVLQDAGNLAKESGLECYTVGGFVRDLVLNTPSKDVDIMVIGDGVEFARKLGQHLKVPDIVEYGEFGTALIPYGEFLIEVASARTETYESDSRKPKVVYTNLKGDLSRRILITLVSWLTSMVVFRIFRIRYCGHLWILSKPLMMILCG